MQVRSISRMRRVRFSLCGASQHDLLQFASLFTGDPSWPDDTQCSLLNHTIGGAVIKTIPIAAPSHPGPSYSTDECNYMVPKGTNSSVQEVLELRYLRPLTRLSSNYLTVWAGCPIMD
jgi:hypothetical protein